MRFSGLLVAFICLVASVAQAQSVREQRVHFAAGRSSATLAGRIRGYEIVDYVLGASARQRMTVDMQTSNLANYFNVLPGNSETAIHIGSTSGNRFDGSLPQSGDYRIRVYLMRSAARRNETANYTLTIAIRGAGAAAPLPSNPDYADGNAGGPDFWRVANLRAGDTLNVRAGAGTKFRIVGQLANGDRVRNLGCATVAGSRWCRIEAGGEMRFTGWVNGRYIVEVSAPRPPAGGNSQARGEVPCSTAAGQPTGRCAFRVSRGRDGNAGVWVALPGGRERYIEFRGGVPVGTDRGFTIGYEKMSDLFLIRIGGVERYEVPEAVVYGG